MNNQNNPNKPNMLFYSAECRTCEVFIKTAHANGILKRFSLVPIDDNKDKFIKMGLRKVFTTAGTRLEIV